MLDNTATQSPCGVRLLGGLQHMTVARESGVQHTGSGRVTSNLYLDTKGAPIHTARTTHPELSSCVNRVRVEGRRAPLRCTMGSHAAGHQRAGVGCVSSKSGVDAAGAGGSRRSRK